MRWILNTVGLSVLTNGLKDVFKSGEIYKYANVSIDEIDMEFKNRFETEVVKLKEKVVKASENDLKSASAELNALIRYYNDGFNHKDIFRLLCTDTYLGEKSAEILKYFLENQGLNVSIYKPSDLKTSDIEVFHLAISDIVKELSEEITGYKLSGYEIVFNLTGGFKSINSFLQIMASLYADKSIYVFETSDDLLTIPRMPIKIDNSIITDNINLFRRLDIGIEIEKEYLSALPVTLISHIGDEYTLSAWGEMIWRKVKAEAYEQELVLPLGKIQYGKQFEKDFLKLNPLEKYQINKKIDMLEKYLLTKENLSSLRYHALAGQVAQQFSHEFYPFDGGDSRRAYCNELNGMIIIEKLDAHLK